MEIGSWRWITQVFRHLHLSVLLQSDQGCGIITRLKSWVGFQERYVWIGRVTEKFSTTENRIQLDRQWWYIYIHALHWKNARQIIYLFNVKSSFPDNSFVLLIKTWKYTRALLSSFFFFSFLRESGTTAIHYERISSRWFTIVTLVDIRYRI